MARCDPAPVFWADEHVLDLVAEAILRRVVWDLDLSTDARRYTRRNPQFDLSVAEPIRIIPHSPSNPLISLS
jgi:hypothetical protein